MRILGIDPGFERLGIAILESASAKSYGETKKKHEHVVIFSECFKTSSKLEFSERLVLIGNRIEEIIEKFKPEVLAIETLFLNTNQKTVMRVSEARGVVLYEAKKANLEIIELSPLQIKMATTGYGRSDKAQIMKMVKMLVSIDKNVKSDDELDAIAVALATFAQIR
jgi:crossover junction endodeoxyribonuclease RuvC